MTKIFLVISLFLLPGFSKSNTRGGSRFKVLALYEGKGHHVAYTTAAIQWLNQLATDSSFTINYITHTDTITSKFLQQYNLFIQLDYPPYGWSQEATAAFEKYIETGQGGWIGFHHASLLGEFDGFQLWPWFYHFMGNIRFQDYISTFTNAAVHIEDTTNPVIKSLPKKFTIAKEEWYTYDASPRPNVKVIATVDETSYQPGSNIKMGDHPVIWTNMNYKARNIYIFMGHSPALFTDSNYTTLFRNAVFWAAAK